VSHVPFHRDERHLDAGFFFETLPEIHRYSHEIPLLIDMGKGGIVNIENHPEALCLGRGSGNKPGYHEGENQKRYTDFGYAVEKSFHGVGIIPYHGSVPRWKKTNALRTRSVALQRYER
jgi:hypothetical protein